ncbi:MAG: tRNA pseudouridine(38-40) synthase TruA [Vicinamibacteria bacterium]
MSDDGGRPEYNQRVTLSYDGYGFAGFQAQDADKGRTVQGEVEAALQRLHQDVFIRIQGSGRTDQGVHALGQVISFRGPRPWPDGELARALNSTLPKDVRALSSSIVDASFHARRSAVSKHYRYLLDVCDTQHPVRRRYVGHTGYKLDREAVALVASLFVGRKDFASLQNAGTDVKTTVRTVTRSEVTWDGSTMTFDVEADGFLRRMVRAMVGGLISAGRGAVTVDQLKDALASADRSLWPAPAAPEGLYLVEVKYGVTQ